MKFNDLEYTYKHLSVWAIPRFGHEKGPLVFRGLERSLGLENNGYMLKVNISTNEECEQASRENFGKESTFFCWKNEQNMLRFL